MGSYLDDNLTALSESQPALAARLKNLEAGAELKVLTSRAGGPVIVKKGVSLNSRHDPTAEALAWAKSPPVEEARKKKLVPLIFGLGSGYHVRAASGFFPRLAVFEPDPAVILTVFSLADWKDLLPKITFFTVGDDLPEWARGQAALLVHRPTQRLHPVEWARLKTAATGLDVKINRPGPGLKILVVTPIYGGSWPVAVQAAKGLENLGHQVVKADMSPLDQYHREVRKPGVSPERRGEVEQRLLRFTGEYLFFMAEKEKPQLLLALAQAPLEAKSLARIRSLGIKTAFWFVEDFRFMEYYREIAAAYDFFFHIQPETMGPVLQKMGVSRHRYLPLAADPEVFRPMTDPSLLAPYRTDLSFMGAAYPNRRAVFSRLLDFDFKIWGTGWEEDPRFAAVAQDRGRRVSTGETVLIYNAARVNLNLHSSAFTEGLDDRGGFINPRTFEIASCRAFQLVDRRHPLALHFDLEKEMATFADSVELREKIGFYLQRPDLRKEMAQRAARRVQREHTYTHRMREMIEYISED